MRSKSGSSNFFGNEKATLRPQVSLFEKLKLDVYCWVPCKLVCHEANLTALGKETMGAGSVSTTAPNIVGSSWALLASLSRYTNQIKAFSGILLWFWRFSQTQVWKFYPNRIEILVLNALLSSPKIKATTSAWIYEICDHFWSICPSRCGYRASSGRSFRQSPADGSALCCALRAHICSEPLAGRQSQHRVCRSCASLRAGFQCFEHVWTSFRMIPLYLRINKIKLLIVWTTTQWLESNTNDWIL